MNISSDFSTKAGLDVLFFIDWRLGPGIAYIKKNPLPVTGPGRHNLFSYRKKPWSGSPASSALWCVIWVFAYIKTVE